MQLFFHVVSVDTLRINVLFILGLSSLTIVQQFLVVKAYLYASLSVNRTGALYSNSKK